MDQEYIDLIAADIMMPKMDGYVLTKSIREANMDLPILMVTAKDQFDDMQKGFRMGTDDYMIKPINVKELVLRVEALLRRAKIQSEKKITIGNTMLDYDTRDGMSEEVQKHIFEKFYQGDSSRKAEGNGLGLALVKRILDLCKGEISLESAPGKGAAFSISLPQNHKSTL